MPITNRRRFLKRFLGGATAAVTAPAWTGGFRPVWADEGYRRRLPLPPRHTEGVANRSEASAQEEEWYWQKVQDQFSLEPGLILMNAANLCPAPLSVQETVFQHTRDINRDPSFQNRGKFGDLKERARQALADHVGAAASEIAIPRNTSEANNTVVNGLDLGPGDEVVIWDQNHPTNNVAWDVRAERWGFAVKRVSTPVGAESSHALMDAFAAAMGPRTRVLAFSHVSNVSGVRLPARELCGLARGMGILSLVDGAQTFGALSLDLQDLGCDFFTASSHKWLMGPKEAGLLYVREESQDRLWPSEVGVGWEGARDRGAQKFENMGQRDDAAVAALAPALAFHRSMGPDRVEARVKGLAQAVKDGLSEAVRGVRFHTPINPDLTVGVVVFSLAAGSHSEVYQTLYRDHGIGCAAMGGDFDGLRLSPHVYNTMDEVRAVVEAVAAHA